MKGTSRCICIFIILQIILIGCASNKTYYFISEIKSDNNDIEFDNKGVFKAKYEDFYLKYVFSGKNISIRCNIENNSNDTAKIDWTKLTLKINQLTEKKISSVTGIDSSTIAPSAKENYTILKTSYVDMRRTNKKGKKKEYKYKTNKKSNIKSAFFNLENSPLIVRSNINISSSKIDTIISSTFYIASINRINRKMYLEISSDSSKKENMFYTSFSKDMQDKDKLFNQLMIMTYNLITNSDLDFDDIKQLKK